MYPEMVPEPFAGYIHGTAQSATDSAAWIWQPLQIEFDNQPQIEFDKQPQIEFDNQVKIEFDNQVQIEFDYRLQIGKCHVNCWCSEMML